MKRMMVVLICWRSAALSWLQKGQGSCREDCTSESDITLTQGDARS